MQQHAINDQNMYSAHQLIEKKNSLTCEGTPRKTQSNPRNHAGFRLETIDIIM
jgi:hypothetical protein